VAVAVVELSAVKKWTHENGNGIEGKEALTNPAFKKMVLDNLMDLAKSNKFSGLEKVKKIHLTLEPFTIENDILTPTMKIKRNVAQRVF
jgi:long-chain acyl-CoA synthetase